MRLGIDVPSLLPSANSQKALGAHEIVKNLRMCKRLARAHEGGEKPTKILMEFLFSSLRATTDAMSYVLSLQATTVRHAMREANRGGADMSEVYSAKRLLDYVQCARRCAA